MPSTWYSRIAPASWLLAKDEGRQELNFSTWSRYDSKRHRKLFRESPEDVREGKMPMPIYTLARPDARLGAEDIATFERWVSEQVVALDAEP